MIHKLNLGHVQQPDLYVASNKIDIQTCKDAGIPYIVRPKGVDDETLIIAVMLPVMEKILPHIKWRTWFRTRTGHNYSTFNSLIINVPGEHVESEDILEERGDGCVADIATDDRTFNCRYEEKTVERKLYEWLEDDNSSVNIDYLMTMELMPAFCLDVTKAIEKNLIGFDWSDGYNKKLGMVIGNYDTQKATRNLLIIDVSSSIPRGISSTMITLAETLRNRMNAELIITGSHSKYWGLEDDLPDPKTIRNTIGYANESYEFANILRMLSGSEFANVVCFGDNDMPWQDTVRNVLTGKPAIIVHNLLSFHTKYDQTPGYARYLKEINKDLPGFYERIDTSWARIMD